MAFRSDFSQHHTHRQRLLRRIAEDMTNSCEDFHVALITAVMIDVHRVQSNRARSRSAFLRGLARVAPIGLATSIFAELTAHRSAAIRNDALRQMGKAWNDGWEGIVWDAWQRHGDHGAAIIIGDHFPENVILENIIALFPHLLERPGVLARLCNRLGSAAGPVLNRLRKLDEITYCYVLVKTGRKMSNSTALKIFRGNLFDDRLSLLVWCFGRMGLWSAIIRCEAMAAATPEIMHRRFPILHASEEGEGE